MLLSRRTSDVAGRSVAVVKDWALPVDVKVCLDGHVCSGSVKLV